MKQHIEWKDLRETETEIIIKLLEYSAKEDGEEDVVFDRKILTFNIDKMKNEIEDLDPFRYLQGAFISMCEWLTVGKMIEILRDMFDGIEITPHNNLHIGYTIGSLYPDGINFNPVQIYSSPKWLKEDHTKEENDKYYDEVFCNSLWEAVKYVLKEES